jgi:RND family efflux transporter MFP subunit
MNAIRPHAIGPLKLLLGVSAAAVMAAAQAGCDKAPAAVETPPPKVNVAKPEIRAVVDFDRYNGWLQPVETVEVRARVRGHLDKIHFTDGDMVKKDQLLFELDPRPLQADVDRAKDQVKVYAAQWTAASKEEARLKELVAKGGASRSQVDAAEAQTGSLEAQIEATKQEVRRKELDVEYSRVVAPIAGRIGRALMTTGNLVNAGGSDPVLTTIVSVDPIYVYFDVDERSLQRYFKARDKSGTTRPAAAREAKLPFTFGLETDEGFPHRGVIDFADNRIDPQTGTVSIRGVLPNPNARFVPGSRVRIRVPIGQEQPALVVPDTAILTDQDKRYVLAVDDKNIVHRRDVEPGKLLDDGGRVVRIRPGAGGAPGLSENDWIVTLGLQLARINYPVDPVRPAAAAAGAATEPTGTPPGKPPAAPAAAAH